MRGTRTATRASPGTMSLKISSPLPSMSICALLKPVTLPRQAFHEAANEWIDASCHHDRNVVRDRPRGARGDNAFRKDDVDPRIHQRHRKLLQTGYISVAPLRDQHEIASLHPTATGKPTQECPEVALGRWFMSWSGSIPCEGVIRALVGATAHTPKPVASPVQSAQNGDSSHLTGEQYARPWLWPL
jgi:hypothetical protein